MLDKARNTLIGHAFQLAGISSPESEPTAAEIADAVHTLNTMLQSWNNDGFRLFKIKRGYLPFISGENEYNLSTQAYKNFASSSVSKFKTIGGTKIAVSTISNMGEGDKVVFINNTISEAGLIKEIDYANAVVTLKDPLNMAIYKNNNLFYGDFKIAQTNKITFNASFNSISYKDQDVDPVAGQTLYFSLSNNWVKVIISSVDVANKVIVFAPSVSAGDITNDYIVYGNRVAVSKSLEDYPLTPRKLISNGFEFAPESIALPSKDGLGEIVDVEYTNSDNTEIILKKALQESTLAKLGKQQIDSSIIYPTQVEMTWSDISSLVPQDELDWGYVRDLHTEANDWGFVTDPAIQEIDWGNLTGDAELVGFGKKNNDMYALAQDTTDNELFMFYKKYGSAWELMNVSSYNLTDYNLYMANGSVYVFDVEEGVFNTNEDNLVSIYSDNGVEAIVKFGDKWYLISPLDTTTQKRTVCSTSDFNTFSATWEIALPSVENEAEFLGKMFIGTTDTYVTADMKTVVNANAYSQNRCVVGDRLLNLNTSQICSYTIDGVKFNPMPLMLSNETCWAYKDGCSFIAIYGVLTKEGYIGTQIFTTNDFNPIWTAQTAVPGRVFNILFDDQKAYFLSDMEVVSLTFYKDVKTTNVDAYGFGKKIGRPQEIMNVMKYGLDNDMELPMNALALKDFLLLPRQENGGEPINYCFFRDAIDGKLMVWGTPNKFGEYLRFSYVEPITLLEDADSTPDFPDEYYEAVECGLAAELAYNYQLPLERIQILQAKAEAAKEDAILHDNEDTSYDIVPNQRGL